MGGNVFKDTNVRLPTSEANAIGEKIIETLSRYSSRCNIIPSYRTKTTCGDIDILAEVGATCVDLDLATVLSPTESPIKYVRNGPVVSYAYPLENGTTFQVDIIWAPPQHYDFSLRYYSWNDLGNLIGRFAHKMNVKFGHDGLFYTIRHNSRVIETVNLTRDFKEALMFLGFDFNKFEEGFDTLEDIFEYVSDNPRYYGEIFNLQNRSHNARVRDRKRATYSDFLTWIENHPEKDATFRYNDNKDVYLEEVFIYFPCFAKTYDFVRKKINIYEKFKQRANSNIIKELTGLADRDLGDFMQYLRTLGWGEFGGFVQNYVACLPDEELATYVEGNLMRYRVKVWFNLLLSDPDKSSECPQNVWDEFNYFSTITLLLKHPQLIVYMDWNKLNKYDQDKLLSKHPAFFMPFI